MINGAPLDARSLGMFGLGGSTGVTIVKGSTVNKGATIAFRTEESREEEPDKLSLEKRGLTTVPILEGEGRLRLLGLGGNRIRVLDRLAAVPSLIFLDVYNNDLQGLDGLDPVPLLRVLMAGKNAISSLAGLEYTPDLDVLDLHANLLTTQSLTPLALLSSLRVLNLAGNRLTSLPSLDALVSLVELNVRHNKIARLGSLAGNTNLERVFLSHNALVELHHLDPLAALSSILELHLAGNPCTDHPLLPDHLSSLLPTLSTLDSRPFVPQTIIPAPVPSPSPSPPPPSPSPSPLPPPPSCVGESDSDLEDTQSGDDGSEAGDGSLGDEDEESGSRPNAVSSVRIRIPVPRLLSSPSQTTKPQQSMAGHSSSSSSSMGSASKRRESSQWRGEALLIANEDTSILERGLGRTRLKHLVFDGTPIATIKSLLGRLRKSYPGLSTLVLKSNGLTSLTELDPLSHLGDRLRTLVIDSETNPKVGGSPLFRPYVLTLLPSLETFNSEPVTASDLASSQSLFGHTANAISSLRSSLGIRIPPRLSFSLPQADSVASVAHSTFTRVLDQSIAETSRVNLVHQCWEDAVNLFLDSNTPT